MGYIYVFEFPNGKRYVGATIQKPKYRWNNGKNYRVGTPVRTAIDEFGWRYVTKLCCEVPDSELDEQERYWIEKYKTTDPEYGYNIHSGGKKGFTGGGGENHPLYGKHHSEETCRKISEHRSGIKTSEEGRINMSKAHKGQVPWINGKHHSDEAKRKISEASKLMWAKKKGLA